MSNLIWGKTQQQLQAERQQMIFEREEIARRDEEQQRRRIAALIRDQRAMTPGELGKMYGDRLMPAKSIEPSHARMQAYHFGTDIPFPSNDEVAESLAQRIPPGHRLGLVLMGAAAWGVVLAFAAALLYLMTR